MVRALVAKSLSLTAPFHRDASVRVMLFLTFKLKKL
jgi:hypothetical protein